tara:strand:+ start:244 stop:489 length:246 start_codon:yes stop_codon:yes gene_type:complete
MKAKDKLVQKIINRFVVRSNAGIKKFGNEIIDADKPLIQWIDDTQEELMDSIVYLEKIKHELKKEEKSLIEILSESYGGTQ